MKSCGWNGECFIITVYCVCQDGIEFSVWIAFLVFILSIPCTLNHLRVTRGVKEKCISTSNTSLNISELIYITREIATVDPTLLSFLV